MNTLVIDGDNLLTIGFYGRKNYFYNGNHIGGIYHFLTTLKYLIEQNQVSKVCVFWDGENGSQKRKEIYPQYKENRTKKNQDIELNNSYNYQRIRVKEYLEELYIRQGEYDYCESDDCISFYIKNSPNEKKIILSADADLLQLLDENTILINPLKHKSFDKDSKLIIKDNEIILKNILLIKLLCGDNSDNISGIKGLGLKTLLKFFPEIKEKETKIEEILEKTAILLENNKKVKIFKNILDGTTKYGKFGIDLYKVNSSIIDLNNPILTEDAMSDIISLINEKLDSENRSYKNTLKMMLEDGIFNLLPKNDNAWIDFLNPYLILIRKEKNYQKN